MQAGLTQASLPGKQTLEVVQAGASKALHSSSELSPSAVSSTVTRLPFLPIPPSQGESNVQESLLD